MIRGTTPTHKFNVSFDTSKIKEVRIVYAQDDEIVFIKATEDCKINEDSIEVTLTQADTFKLNCKKSVQVQLRILTNDEKVLSSVVQQIGIAKCLDNEVM